MAGNPFINDTYNAGNSYYDSTLGYVQGWKTGVHARIGTGSFAGEVEAIIDAARSIIRDTTVGFQWEAKRILHDAIERNVYSYASTGYRRGDDGGLKSIGTMHYKSSVLKTMTGFSLTADAPPQGSPSIKLDEYMEFYMGREFYKEAEEEAMRRLEELISSRLSEL